ncbi:MAG TPA: SusC/RagA family TonB-linked outer membrane protein, partial [Puia sp.]|nr:SusC/RagA family TonB-linked outer membrane protein [Puia sp.]
ALVLLAVCLHVSAVSLAQKVTLSEHDAPLKKIFRSIKEQTGYVFFYNSSLLDRAHPVTISVKDEDLRTVLEACFRDQPLSWNIVNKTVVVSARKETNFTPPPVTADTVQPFIVTGRITDETGRYPLVGANVEVEGKKGVGAVADNNGEFHLAAAPGATLLISYVGYLTQRVTVRSRGPVQIRLAQGTKDPLANMVVTGYQLINKESFTGNAITVSGEDLKKVNPQNFLESISVFDPSFSIAQNNLAGSNPNTLPSINVRGSTGLPTGGGAVVARTDLTSDVNLPTFIMDGYEVSLEKVFDLDVNRIRSITLLKDAAATAVYGSRAANGVVVITTKAPKPGKLQVYYNYELNTTAPDLDEYHVLNARQKLQYEKLAGLYDTAMVRNGESQDLLNSLYYGKLLNVNSGINTYWLSQPLRTTYGQKHSLYLEGGDNSMRYGVNLLYQTSPGVMKGSSRDRYELGMDLSYNPGKTFIFRNSLSVAQVNSLQSPYGSFQQYAQMNPYFPKTDSAGHILQAVDSWQEYTGGTSYATDVVLNPMYDATLHSFNKSAYLEVTDAFSAEWNMARGLRLRTVISYDQKRSTIDSFASPLSNAFYFYKPRDYSTRGSYFYGEDEERTFDGSATFTFNRQIGYQFINLAVGANARTYTSDIKSLIATGFTNDVFTNIGYANGYQQGSTPVGDFSQERLFGSFLSLNYSWQNKYLLDLSVREDGSSQFGTESKVAPFWAMGIGWNAYKEDFLVGSPVISQLRFRASTGITGSVSFPPYQSETTYHYYTTNWYSTGVGASVLGYGNQGLQWQKTQNYDAGMDLGLFKDRVVISPRYYYKYTRGLLADIDLPPSTGFPSYTANLGDMINKGIELNVKYTVIRNRKLNVSLFANLVHNTNTIARISDALKNYNQKANQAQETDSLKATPLLRYQEGQPLSMIYAVRSLGIDPENGKEIFVKKDGTHTYTWSADDIVPVADPTPKVNGSFGSTVSYKRFLLNVIFTTRLGGKDYNQTLVDRVENADPRFNVDSRALTDRWQKPGDHAAFKNVADLGSSFLSSRFIQNDNTLDFTTLYLSYDFDKSVYARMGMKNLRLAFTMNDVAHWSTFRIERGIDYPYAKSFTLSVQTSF